MIPTDSLLELTTDDRDNDFDSFFFNNYFLTLTLLHDIELTQVEEQAVIMFLHSGASLHGHEYSNRQAASIAQGQPPRRSPLLRSALTPPKRVHSATPPPRPTSLPPQRVRASSELTPRSLDPIMVRFQDPESEPEPETLSLSVYEGHESESELSDVTEKSTASPRKRRRRRRATRTSTRYSLGYPAPKKLTAPKVIQKVLPRLLLQLQIPENGWGKPVMEVFPATRIAGPVTTPRVAKCFPGVLSAKRQLARDDIVLIERNDRTKPARPDRDEDEKEDLEHDKVLAVYSPVKHSDSAEIVLEDGAVWVATPLPSGSINFVHVDAAGNQKTVRWAKRIPGSRSSANTPPTSPKAGAESSLADSEAEAKFTFSIINPNSRRHPVMATLTHSTLDVQDTYTSVFKSSGRHPLSRPVSGISDDQSIDLENDREPPRASYPIDDATKTLISITALWVALRSGWSPNYTPASTPESPPAKRLSGRSAWGRLEDNPMQSSSSETSDTKLPKRASMPPTTSAAASLRGRSLSPEPVNPPSAMAPTPPPKPIPRRATSSGAAFMQRQLRTQVGTGAHPRASQDKEPGSALNDSRTSSSTTWSAGSQTALYPNKPQDAPVPAAAPLKPSTELPSSDEEDVVTPLKVDAIADVHIADVGHHKHKGFRARLSRWMGKLR